MDREIVAEPKAALDGSRMRRRTNTQGRRTVDRAEMVASPPPIVSVMTAKRTKLTPSRQPARPPGLSPMSAVADKNVLCPRGAYPGCIRQHSTLRMTRYTLAAHGSHEDIETYRVDHGA
uniref:Uncharacterized protein n=1 Tax=Plectus sambesii TaxID=2011161 RepID=A0A914UIL8_9BILA